MHTIVPFVGLFSVDKGVLVNLFFVLCLIATNGGCGELMAFLVGGLLRDRLVSRRNDKKVPAPSEKGKVDEKQKNEQDGTSSTKRTSIQNAYTNRDLCHTRPRRTREIASQNLRVNRI